MREHATSEGYLAELIHLDRVHQEGDVGAFADAGESFLRIAVIGDVFLVADGFFGESEQMFQQNFVQVDDVQLALIFGDLLEQLVGDVVAGVQQETFVA